MSVTLPNADDATAARALVVCRDPTLAAGVARCLRRSGLEVSTPAGMCGALDVAEERPLDLAVVELMLPRVADGARVLHALRHGAHRPWLLALRYGRGRDERAVARLAGADGSQLVTRPAGEIAARARELLARGARPADAVPLRAPRGTLGDCEFDDATCAVRLRDRVVSLRRSEYRLLRVLWARRGSVVSRETLLRDVWGPAADAHRHTLDVHLATLRYRFARGPRRACLILTMPSLGYQLLTREALPFPDPADPHATAER